MQLAIVDGERKLAFKGGRGICSCCGITTIAKVGNVRMAHWAHETLIDCDPWHEGETEWHREWKNKFPISWREVTLTDESCEKHRADVKTPDGIVLEFQNSQISIQDVEKRENFYKTMIWVINAQKFNLKFSSNVISVCSELDREASDAVDNYYDKLDEDIEETEQGILELNAEYSKHINELDKYLNEIKSLRKNKERAKVTCIQIAKDIANGNSSTFLLKDFRNKIEDNYKDQLQIIDLKLKETKANVDLEKLREKRGVHFNPTKINGQDALMLTSDYFFLHERYYNIMIATPKTFKTWPPTEKEIITFKNSEEFADFIATNSNHHIIIYQEPFFTGLQNSIEALELQYQTISQSFMEIINLICDDYNNWIDEKINKTIIKARQERVGFEKAESAFKKAEKELDEMIVKRKAEIHKIKKTIMADNAKKNQEPDLKIKHSTPYMIFRQVGNFG